MTEKIKDHLQSVFSLLLSKDKIKIPDKKIVSTWENILSEWVNDESMTLFARKGGKIRGSKIEGIENREILYTDNTPAHWVFKNIFLDKMIVHKSELKILLNEKKFPLCFIRKKAEHETLTAEMVATKDTRLTDYKLTHIDRIAMKRGENISIEDYKNHHFTFLNLSNMYLIDKEFSGLAEVPLFNEIIKEYKKSIGS